MLYSVFDSHNYWQYLLISDFNKLCGSPSDFFVDSDDSPDYLATRSDRF